jgi:hypothetical protein
VDRTEKRSDYSSKLDRTPQDSSGLTSSPGRQGGQRQTNKGFAAMSRGGTNFFLLLDIGVPPPDTAQTPGTLSAIINEKDLYNLHFYFV